MTIDPRWLAGFFDGEGCACATWNKRQPRLPRIRVNITQSDRDVLNAIGIEFPPSRIHRIHEPFGKRPCYQITWEGRKAISFLEAIRPYVRLKKIQVDAALAALALVPPRGQRSSDALAKIRTGLAKVIKDANSHKQTDQVVN